MYVDADRARWIVATNGDWDGAFVELSAQLLTDEEHLGAKIIDALNNSRPARESDGPGESSAFRASGERSQRRFEDLWETIHVRGANDHNVTWIVSGPDIDDFGLHLEAAVAPTMDADRLEAAVRLVLDRTTRFRSTAE